MRLWTYLGSSASSTSSADGSNSYSGSTSPSGGGSVPSTTSSGNRRMTSASCTSIDLNRVKTTWSSSTKRSGSTLSSSPSSTWNARTRVSPISRALEYSGLSEKPVQDLTNS